MLEPIRKSEYLIFASISHLREEKSSMLEPIVNSFGELTCTFCHFTAVVVKLKTQKSWNLSTVQNCAV